jgi:hypothetical protein
MLRRIKDDPVLSPEEKVEYGNLLRSQLTGFEIALAGLNGLSKVSNDFSSLVKAFWPAPGSEDTELGVLMELEVGHGEAEVYAGVQA